MKDIREEEIASLLAGVICIGGKKKISQLPPFAFSASFVALSFIIFSYWGLLGSTLIFGFK